MSGTRPPRIGIPIIADTWLGGVNYVIHLFLAGRALPEDVRPKLVLVVQDRFLNERALAEHRRILPLADLVAVRTADAAKARALLGPGVVVCADDDALFEHIDFYFPVHSDVLENRPAASWIPDFQHKRLPEYCSAAELAKRDAVDRKVAARARHVVFSSQAAQADFNRFFPGAAPKQSVLHFTSVPEASWYEGDPDAVRSRLGLPERYLICCNQFWMHKDHKTLFQAMAVLKRMGRGLPLVCTGPTQDYRNKGYFGELTAMLKALGIADQVHILGCIERADQIQLVRGALAVVQPSLFEGWSTVVEDCRLLGKTLFLSDIDVHREQAPEHGILFKAGDPADLTQKILAHAGDLTPTHGGEREARARADADQRIQLFGLKLTRIAQEGMRLGRETGARPAAQPPATQAAEAQGSSAGNETPTIATSIAPFDLEKQQRAVRSWLDLGFAVESLNPPEEIPLVREHFPEVTFIPVARNAKAILGKPLVYLDDFFAHFAASGRAVCAMVNSDVILDGAPDLARRLAAEAADAFVFGSRLDVPDEASRQGDMYHKGFDFFFFDRRFLPLYKPSEFSIGAPWWDYWIVIVPILAGVAAKRVRTPVAFHPLHELAWSWDGYIRMTREAVRGLGIPGIDPESIPLKGWTDKTLELCRLVANSVLEQIQERSLPLDLDAAPGGRTSRWPRISIVTPSFNQGRYIEKTIRSILDQGYPNLEYIIMDGGSTDETVEVIKRYESRIDFWVSERDKGQSDAINKGLARSGGEIFNWINSDDWLEPGALFRVAEAWREHPDAAGWVGACRRIDPEGRQLNVIFPNSLSRSNLGHNWNGKQIYQPACFIDTALAKRFGVDVNLFYCMDQGLYFHMLEHAPFVCGRGIWASALIHPEAKTTADRDALHREVIVLQRERGFHEGADVRQSFSLEGGPPGFVIPDGIKDRLARMRQPGAPEGTDFSGLRLAVVSNFLPRHDVSAANHRLLEIIRILRKGGAQVDYYYFHATRDDARYARDLGGPAERLPEEPEAAARAIAARGADAVWLSNLWTPEFLALQTRTMLALRGALPGARMILDTMDLHSRKFLRRHLLSKDGADLVMSRAFLALERRAYPLADHVLAVSEEERAAILTEVPQSAPVSVVPNIHVPVQRIAPMYERHGLVFLGNYELGHNADAARLFMDRILPHISARSAEIKLHLIGKGADKVFAGLRSEHVRVVGYVPDLMAALARYRVFVCPMAYGTGLKGKIGMAAAAGLPVVTTTIGAEGFGFTDGTECFIADDHEEFALKTLQVYEDRVTWHNFSLEGVLAVADRFSPRAAAASLRRLFAG